MPAVSFIPGPGDSQAGGPLAQMGALLSILRENKESEARIAASHAAIQESAQRGEIARQQAMLLGLEVRDFPQKQADARELQQAQIGEHQAQTEHFQNQDYLAQMLEPGQEASHWATAGAEQQRQRAEAARADQLDLHNQQLKDADKELKDNSDWIMSAYGFEGPAKKFNLNFITAPIIQDLAKTQADTRLKAQHGEMYDAIAGKAKDWARVQEERITNSGTSKNIDQITKLARINPAAASAWENDSDPVVASAARIIAATPKAEKALTSDQLMARIMLDPNAPVEAKQKAAIWMGQMRGMRPDPVQGYYDATTGTSVGPHYDWDSFQGRLEDQAKALISAMPAAPTIAPITTPSTQPTKIKMTAPDGTPVLIRPDQVDAVRAMGYKDRQ